MSQSNSQQMGTLPIPKLLLQLSLPLTVALLINNLYNLVDSIFIAHLNEKALTALSLAAPIQALIAALGSGMAVGLNAAISHALGKKDSHRVKATAATGIFMAFGAYLLILFTEILILKPFLSWQTADPEIFTYGLRYLRICMLCSLPNMLQWVFDRFLIATGHSLGFIVSLTSASIVNLILDPIFIFGFLGLPAMGTAGAAAATVIGQLCGAIVSLIINLRYNHEIPITITIRPNRSIVVEILQIGIPTALIQGITSVVGMIVNFILNGFSSTAVAVYGVCLKIQNIVLTFTNGINLALIPVMAYNDGAGLKKRKQEIFRWSVLFSTFFMLFITCIVELFTQQILQMFNASAQMMEIGISALRILMISFFFSTYSFNLGAALQAIGHGISSMLLTSFRQAFFLLPILLLFSLSKNLNLFWFGFVLTEWLGLALAFLMHRKYFSYKT